VDGSSGGSHRRQRKRIPNKNRKNTIHLAGSGGKRGPSGRPGSEGVSKGPTHLERPDAP
jgi:hypothetical protein